MLMRTSCFPLKGASGVPLALTISTEAADKVYREAGEMNMNRQTGNANSSAAGHTASATAPAVQSCYVESAPVVDVLFDQLQYLVTHSGRSCPPDCLECGRLERVKHWLLLPFRGSGTMM
jgi:hypothetical protein